MERVRAAGRRVFLTAERVFDAAFGDRLNPFYHLGEIAFLAFWITAASGLYLYIFLETGVQEAYASVRMLHETQPWAGGLLRSIHRYASDAMVFVMLLHLLRHFCFDRYRGYRWFSWLSGVAVLWLAYISGIGGFMLPWDRLAQFVVVATTEWLDALPLFSGRLARNFLTDTAVSDRLFSLLSFLHIGVPLVLLMVLWIHIQRVPKARTVPPWPVALAFTLSLTALAALRPVLGGGPASLGSLPEVLDFDWWYLATFPVMYASSAAAAWAMLVAGTLLLTVLPWLPPRRAGSGWHVTFHPGGRTVHVREGETLLDAGLRAGMPLRYECRSGGCGVCKARVIAGQADVGPHQPSALPPSERALGIVLTCCTKAASDAEIEYEPAAEGAHPWRRLRVTVTAQSRAAPEVMILTLSLPEGDRLGYEAGQYFNVILEDGARRAYSFASAPEASTATIEMHVRLVPGGRFTTHVFQSLKVGDTLDIEGPFGQFTLRDSTRPMLFAAGATGFAPVKSLLEHAFRTGIQRPMALYWGVRHAADLYLHEVALSWAREHPHFTYVPVLSEPDAQWDGRQGLVHAAILADHPDLRGFEIYTCGSVQMVTAARPDFLAHGLAEDACFTDAFTPGVRA